MPFSRGAKVARLYRAECGQCGFIGSVTHQAQADFEAVEHNVREHEADPSLLDLYDERRHR